MNIPDVIGKVQIALGFTNGDVDGKAGPQTWAAILAKLAPDTTASASLGADAVDARSESNIATLKANVQPYARALIHKAASIGITIEVISGTRGKAEQDALYAKGRTAPGPKVTNAPFGYSNHNFGIAFDVGVFQNGKYIEESPAYKAVAAIGRDMGLEWGGDWASIDDEPHFQLRPTWAVNMSESEMVNELRGGRAA